MWQNLITLPLTKPLLQRLPTLDIGVTTTVNMELFADPLTDCLHKFVILLFGQQWWWSQEPLKLSDCGFFCCLCHQKRTNHWRPGGGVGGRCRRIIDSTGVSLDVEFSIQVTMRCGARTEFPALSKIGVSVNCSKNLLSTYGRPFRLLNLLIG